MYARRFVIGLLLFLIGVAPIAAQEPKRIKELNEQLLYLLSQEKTPAIETIQQLLDQGAQVNQTVSYKTALMHAASEGHTEALKLLLANGAEVNAQTDEGTALMMAVDGGRPDIVKLLLDAGADVNVKHRLGDSALIMSARRSIPELNPTKGQPIPIPSAEIMSLLLAKGADVNLTGQWGRTALMKADTAVKVKLLLDHGAAINVIDEEGKTALIDAVERGDADGDIDVIRALVTAGADATVRDRKGETALMYALSQSRLEVARLLLRGTIGNVNAQNKNGETLLMRAIKFGDAELVRELLDRGADVSQSDVLGNSAAVFAYQRGQKEIQDLLPPTSAGRNAFLRAAIEKKDGVKVREMVKAGADVNYEYAISYDHRNIKSTVLILAVQTRDAEIVQQLLAAGANVNAKGLLQGSEHGLEYGTAIQAAEVSKNPALVSLLKSH